MRKSHLGIAFTLLVAALPLSCGSSNNSSDMSTPQSCVTEPAPPFSCTAVPFAQATSYAEIINSTSAGVTGIDKTAVLPLRNSDCSLPPLP